LGSGSPTACLSMAPFLFSLHISRSKYAIHFFYAAKKPFWREIGKKKKMSDASTKWMWTFNLNSHAMPDVWKIY
jgi:hypothetical protein